MLYAVWIAVALMLIGAAMLVLDVGSVAISMAVATLGLVLLAIHTSRRGRGA